MAVSLRTLRRDRRADGRRHRRSKDRLGASDHLLNTLVQSSNDVIAVLSETAELLYTNPAGERILGFESEDWEPRSVFELVHPEDRQAAADAFVLELSNPGEQPPSVFRIRTGSGDYRFLEVVATNCLADPKVRGIVLNARDITESENLFRALRTFGQANQALIHATDEESLLRNSCHTIVNAGGYQLAFVGYVWHDNATAVQPIAWAGAQTYLDDLQLSWTDADCDELPIARAIRTGVVQTPEDLGDGAGLGDESNPTAAQGLRTACILPLRVAGEVIGVLGIYSSVPGAFGASQVTLLRELGEALAYGIGRVRDAASLQESEERFRALTGAAPVGILEMFDDGAVHYANSKIAEISARELSTFMDRGWVDAIHPDDVKGLVTFVNHPRTRTDRTPVTAEFRIMRPDGEIRHVRAVGAPKGESLDSGHVVIIEDITEELATRETLAHQAFYDQLTGLPNRALFLDRLNQELVRRRPAKSSIAVLFLDLDRFKIVNDTFGHDMGDAVLMDVASRLERAARSGETAARFSGDEFMFLIRDVSGVDDAIAAARRLISEFEAPIVLHGQELLITASIGIVLPGEGADAATVLRDADTAMYEAKDAGRNRYALFDEDLHRRSVERFTMERELRHALQRDEFEVYYQPIVEPQSGRPVGAEALIRWNHPERGLVPPLEFICVAEDTGLIKPIGSWVLDEALAQLARWDDEPDGPRIERLCVNLSGRQLEDATTIDMVRDALERHAIDPRRVTLEITESILMTDGATAARSLDEFRRLGLNVAIDDFGTGYSSLSYLHTLPVTTVKIDRSFIERLGAPEDSASVVKAIVDMGHATGLDVVAEGVSDENLKARVSEMGCDVAQGFFWSRPLPGGEFAEWWRAR